MQSKNSNKQEEIVTMMKTKMAKQRKVINTGQRFIDPKLQRVGYSSDERSMSHSVLASSSAMIIWMSFSSHPYLGTVFVNL
ncbi:hypothetical protein J6590_048226 [Homalodisca vitripennis]|nr:hypothetical protein J6590_048226 [Homalodisca vitripennis]